MLLDKINILNKFSNWIALFIVIISIGYIYYRLNNQFWSRQPVFHYHNLYYWIIPPGIIQHQKPERNKYYNPMIYFNSFDKIKTEKKALFSTFIKSHFLPDKFEKYDPKKDDILDNFKNHVDKTYVSLFFKKTHLNTNKLIGTMTTKPLECKINNNNIQIYYVDFLCVHKNKRKMGVAQEIIYSHYYNQRQLHKNTIFMFKREGAVTWIVPLTAYKNYGFDIEHWRKKVTFDQPNIDTVLINGGNINLIIDLLLELDKEFDCVIKPNINHIKYLCNTKNLFIYAIMIDKVPVCLYFYKNNHTYYDGKLGVELVGSYNNSNEGIFQLGFFTSLAALRAISPIMKLFIENISNNNILLKKILSRHRPFIETIGSYYFYNFAHHPCKSTELFMLN